MQCPQRDPKRTPSLHWTHRPVGLEPSLSLVLWDKHPLHPLLIIFHPRMNLGPVCSILNSDSEHIPITTASPDLLYYRRPRGIFRRQPKVPRRT